MSRKDRKIALSHDEQILQTKNTFISEGRKKSDKILSNITHRIYGIMRFEALSHEEQNLLTNSPNSAILHENLTNILHNTKILQIFSPIVLIMVCAGNVIALTK